MKASPYFKNLFSLYDAEINDLSTDSSGADVLQARLAEKRRQFDQLLPMLAFSPEMVAPALHGAFRFHSPRGMAQLVLADESRLPGWDALSAFTDVAPWAMPLVTSALAADGGNAFLVCTAALEYLYHHHLEDAAPPVASDDDTPEDDSPHSADEEGGAQGDGDLAEAGDEWMAEQGFDRLG